MWKKVHWIDETKIKLVGLCEITVWGENLMVVPACCLDTYGALHLPLTSKMSLRTYPSKQLVRSIYLESQSCIWRPSKWRSSNVEQ